MKNIYVEQMREVLKKYHSKQKELNKKMAENNEKYSVDYAVKENAKIREQQGLLYNSTKAEITEIYNDVREMLANANFLNVENLTADRLFFEENSGFNLSADEVQAYVQRYEKNFTMLRLIKDWIAKHNTPTNEHRTGKYTNIVINLPADILQAYKKFGEGALAICDKIYGNELIMQDPLEIEHFADEVISKRLYDIVGTGKGLDVYSARRVPEVAQYVFDDVKLKGSDANYYITAFDI